MRFVFQYPEGPFHTTFTLEPRTKTWTVLMCQRTATGAWQEFARYDVRRSRSVTAVRPGINP